MGRPRRLPPAPLRRVGGKRAAEDLYDAADVFSADAEPFGDVVVAIIEAHPDAFMDKVLLIDGMHPEPHWRGNRLSSGIVTDLHRASAIRG